MLQFGWHLAELGKPNQTSVLTNSLKLHSLEKQDKQIKNTNWVEWNRFEWPGAVSCSFRVSKAQKAKALWLNKMSTYDLESYDFQSRALVKGVISGVLLDIEAVWFRENIPGVVDACWLNRMIDGRKEQSISLLKVFGWSDSPNLCKTWICEICGETVCTDAVAVL